MSNKRSLKKSIQIICGNLAGECCIAKLAIPGIETEKMNGIIYQIAELQQNALHRVSVQFPQSPSAFESVKEYHVARRKFYNEAFKSIRNEFNNHVQAIVKEMNALLPAEQKEANRKAVNA